MEASRTAISTLIARAAHQTLDEPLLAPDPVAVRLFAGLSLAKAAAAREDDAADWTRLREHVARRTLHAETALEDAVRTRGIAQYVVLGAGYDTFAYRQPPWAEQLEIFEVDQPATQSAKRAALRYGGVAPPSNLRFVPLDFERSSLRAALAAAGADLEAPLFCSWLGVTPYLTRAAIEATLREIASLRGGAEIAFTFARAGGAWAERAAATGEPWLTTFREDELRALVRELAFDDIAIADSSALARRDAHRLR